MMKTLLATAVTGLLALPAFAGGVKYAYHNQGVAHPTGNVSDDETDLCGCRVAPQTQLLTSQGCAATRTRCSPLGAADQTRTAAREFVLASVTRTRWISPICAVLSSICTACRYSDLPSI